MLNTRDLEERWLKYKIKSYIPHVTIAFSSIIIIIIISIFLNQNIEEKMTAYVEVKPFTTKTTPPLREAIQTNTPIVEEVPRTIAIIPQGSSLKNNRPSLKLSPSLDFMKKMQHSSLPYYQEESTMQQEPVASQMLEEVQELEIEDNIETAVVEEKSKKINIKRRDTSDDIRHIIQRFKKNNNPALSLFIAKKYYELGEYHKAYNYALITNEIDRDIDASWIVFAKSLVKLDQKEMAVKTLKRYTENSHSSSAKILLDEIQSGKFK